MERWERSRLGLCAAEAGTDPARLKYMIRAMLSALASLDGETGGILHLVVIALNQREQESIWGQSKWFRRFEKRETTCNA